MESFLLFVSQLTFNILKVWEIKYTYQNETVLLLINTVLISLVSLLSTYISVASLLDGNWISIIFYIFGSVIGKYIGMTMQSRLTYFRTNTNDKV
jgi:hypothetical protein